MPFPAELENILLMRHGRTDANEKEVLQGQSDWPLNENGKEDVRQSISNFFATDIEPNLSFEKLNVCIISSDLIRAIETSRIVSETLTQLGQGKIYCQLMPSDARLRERNFGPWEGKESAIFQANKRIEWIQAREIGKTASWREPIANEVEMDGELLARVTPALLDFIKHVNNLQFTTPKLLIACGHGSAFRTITTFVAGKDTGKLKNGGICTIQQNDLHFLQQTLHEQGY